jgi:flagellar hook-length control protein FliK
MLAELQQQLNQLTQDIKSAQKKQQLSGNKIAVVDASLLTDMDELTQQLKQLTQWLNRQANNSATATNEPIVSSSVVLTQLQQLLVKISDKTEKQPSGNYLNQVIGQPQANNQEILSTEMRDNIASREIPTAVDLKSATNNEPVVINQKTSNDIASMNTAVVSDVLKPQVEHKATSDGAELSLNQQEQPVKLAATIVSGSPQSSVSLSTLTDVTQSVNQATVDNTAPQTSHEKMIHQQQMQQKLDTLTAIETVAVSRKEFVDDMKTKVMVMIQQKIQQADIQLDPPELGKMHVRVHMHNEQAVVNFVVQTPQAKDALEQQMARLRDQLQQAGVDIGDTNVAQQQQGERNFSEDTTGGHSSRFLESSVSDEEVIVYQGELHNSSATGIDYYA